MQIILDMDSVIYDLHGPWLKLHNQQWPEHKLMIEDHTGWDANAACRAAGCPADMYTYFSHPRVWSRGEAIQDSQEITKKWIEQGYSVVVLTTAANAMSMPYKIEWLQQHFPHLENIMLVHKKHLKHLVRGDILIDDGIHNLEHFEGVKLCYTQPWNKDADILRANNWQETDEFVQMAAELLAGGFTHRHAQDLLYDEMQEYRRELKERQDDNWYIGQDRRG